MFNCYVFQGVYFNYYMYAGMCNKSNILIRQKCQSVRIVRQAHTHTFLFLCMLLKFNKSYSVLLRDHSFRLYTYLFPAEFSKVSVQVKQATIKEESQKMRLYVGKQQTCK